MARFEFKVVALNFYYTELVPEIEGIVKVDLDYKYITQHLKQQPSHGRLFVTLKSFSTLSRAPFQHSNR